MQGDVFICEPLLQTGPCHQPEPGAFVTEHAHLSLTFIDENKASLLPGILQQRVTAQSNKTVQTFAEIRRLVGE
jgi:hypothetical protein